MFSNQLTACLKAYFPAFLDLFSDPDRPVALAVLQRFPTPTALRTASVKRLDTFLRQHHQPGAAAKAQEIHTRLTQPAFQVAPVTLRTKARLAQTLGHQLRALVEEIEAYETEIRRVLRLHPDGELYLSLPGAGDVLAARMVGELGVPSPRAQPAPPL